MADFWYAIRVRSRSEVIVSSMLGNRGYEVFLPIYESRRKWSDRIKSVRLPLFPGYTFCRFDACQRRAVITTSGILSIIGSGNGPTPINDDELSSIRAIVRSGVAAQPWPFLKEGQRVCVKAGPLAGVEGVVLRVSNRERIVVSITLLGRSVAAEIEQDWITAVHN